MVAMRRDQHRCARAAHEQAAATAIGVTPHRRTCAAGDDAWYGRPMRRVVLLVMVGACSDGAQEVPADGDPCAGPPPALPAECAPDGLAGIDLAGTWTLTGRSYSNIAGMVTEKDVVEQRTFARDGTGWCRFGEAAGALAPALDPNSYVDDSQAMRPYQRDYDGRATSEFLLCKRAADGALVFRYRSDGYAQQKPFNYRLEGVLTR